MMTEELQLKEKLFGRKIKDVQILPDGSARLVFDGRSLEIDAVGLVHSQAARVSLRVVEGGQ